MNLPQLPRLPISFQNEQENKEIWQPSWKCFCCHDTGTVQPHLAEKVIPDYDHNRDRLPICQSSPACTQKSRWILLPKENLDMRFTQTICQQLDMHERTAWRLTVERKAINIKSLANKMTMPKVEYHDGRKERNPNDEREIQQPKAEIEAIPPEDWLKMAHEYKYGKKDNND
jgi:hypothetical protein